MISIKNISKNYGSFQVLTDCSTEVEKGEVIVICGPSGSGKSTGFLSAIPGRICPSCARMSAWCFRTSSCFRT